MGSLKNSHHREEFIKTMSTSIILQLNASKIDAIKWSEVFDDCLKIAEAGQLADYEKKTVCGYSLDCLVPVREKDGKIHIIGDTVQGSTVQDFELERDISNYFLQTDSVNDLDYLYNIYTDQRGDSTMGYTPVFGSHTFGAQAHIYLLAIACLIYSAFPDEVVVFGDFAQGQCQRACELAEEITGRKAIMPIQYDHERLYIELQKLGYTGYELIERFMVIYKGAYTESFRALAKEAFDEEHMARFFTEKYADKSLGVIIRNWLEAGLSLDGLCGMIKDHPSFDLVELVDELIIGKVHVKEKMLYDFSREDKLSDSVDDAKMSQSRQNARELGFSLNTIDAYMPLDEIKRTLKKHFPKAETDRYFDNALAGRGKRFLRQRLIHTLYEFAGAEAAKLDEKTADILDPDKLYLWADVKTVLDETVEFELEDTARYYYILGKKFIEQFGLTDAKARKDRIAKLLDLMIALPEDVTEQVINSADDPELSALYFGMLGVKQFDEWSESIVKALLIKPGLARLAVDMVKAK